MSKWGRRLCLARLGFTLIELLIVVAIIAILAAIAVPNFLEAQTRAKVARVKADERSIATAVEAYTVDWNQEPIGYFEAHVWNGTGSNNLMYTLWGGPSPDISVREELTEFRIYANMTTPVAYMNSIPKDPFASAGIFHHLGTAQIREIDKLYRYESLRAYVRGGKTVAAGTPQGLGWMCFAKELGHTFFVSSHGPSRQWAVPCVGAPYGIRQITVQNYLGKKPTDMGPSWQIGYPDALYDPTNGTLSTGWVFRSNKGIPG